MIALRLAGAPARLALAAVLVVLASPGRAAAQGHPPAAPAGPSQADMARARTLYQQGSREYLGGHYDRAIELFLGAYDLSHAPAILFNVAQAFRLKGSCNQALLYYRRSLAEEPDAANRAEVEQRVAEMKRCVEAGGALPDTAQAAPSSSDPDPAPPPDAPAQERPLTAPHRAAAAPDPARAAALTSRPSDHRPGPSHRVLPYLTAAAGGAALLTGGILYLSARAKFNDVESTCPCAPGSFDGWQTTTDVSYVLMGAGAVVAAGGLVWAWRSRSHDTSLRVGLAPGAGRIEWATRF